MRTLDWEVGGVGLALLLAGLTNVTRSHLGDLALGVVGALLIAFATGLPQRLATGVVRGFDRHVRTARGREDVVAAIRLCQNAATDLSSLPTRETGEVKFAAFLSFRRGPSEAVGLYRKRHQAATSHAVEAALRAGAKDGGALQLAEGARFDADLLGLKGELLRIVVELSQGASPQS